MDEAAGARLMAFWQRPPVCCAECGRPMYYPGNRTKCIPCRLGWERYELDVLEARTDEAAQRREAVALAKVNAEIAHKAAERAGRDARLAAVRAEKTAKQRRAQGLNA